MNALTDTYTLQNGVEIPCVGFGTWQVEPGDEAVNAVKHALEAGYRHVDTAQGYHNEESVGRAVRESGLRRDSVFLTTKLTNSVRGYQQTIDAFNASARKLGTDYVDLFLVHWPVPFDFRDTWEKSNAESWRAMEDLHRDGRIRALGVSNFHGKHVEALKKTAKVMPVVNQIRLCPGDTQDEVVRYSRSQGMLLEAYSPLGVGRIFDVPEMQALADKYGRTIAQIAIRWSLERGYLPLPKSVTPERIRENTQVFDFELDPQDVEMMAGLTGAAGTSADPDRITW
ncbi:MAG TPA: aldo/keto reductase [Candidatus Limnocylindria bacterium]|nr:aldo/keto reductase [Candidatus Limnocylindria bacterium]